MRLKWLAAGLLDVFCIEVIRAGQRGPFDRDGLEAGLVSLVGAVAGHRKRWVLRHC